MTADELQVVVVHVGHEHRAHRAEGVGGLRAEPLQILLLPGALADIVACGDAEDMVLDLRLGDVGRLLADDHADLRLVMHRRRVGRIDDRLLVSGERGRELGEKAYVLRRRCLADVAPVVQAGGNHLLGLRRRQVLHLGRLDGPARRFRRPVERVALELANAGVVVLEDAPRGTAADLVLHVANLGLRKCGRR